jgi:DNA-binding IclR family transcriptional regulator
MPSSPSLEVELLRAMLRLARRRTTPTIEQLLLRVPADEPSVRRSFATLVRANLVHITPKGPRLSLTGFAVAVAMAATPRPATVARTTVPMTRRRRAA